MAFSEVQLSKVFVSNFPVRAGSVMLVSAIQELNAFSEIVNSPVPPAVNSTDDRFLQL